MFVATRLTRDAPQRDWWKAALRGCPTWITSAVYLFTSYAVVNFIMFMLRMTSSQQTESDFIRMFSGHWMAFYSVALAILYSFAHTDTAARRCINGHQVSAVANYCEVCGQPVRG